MSPQCPERTVCKQESTSLEQKSAETLEAHTMHSARSALCARGSRHPRSRSLLKSQNVVCAAPLAHCVGGGVGIFGAEVC